MSIWSSFGGIGGRAAPYLDYIDDSGHYAGPDTLDQLHRAGYIDLAQAFGFGSPLLRLVVEDDTERDVMVWLDEAQVRSLIHDLTEWLDSPRRVQRQEKV